MYLNDRVASLKILLSVEQTKSMLKDEQVRQTLFHKKELQYKLDKLQNAPVNNLPLGAPRTTLLKPKKYIKKRNHLT